LRNLPTYHPVTVDIASLSNFPRSGQGLNRMLDTADGKTYRHSHLEPSDARRIFPCFEQPDLKARLHVKLSASADWAILSNQPEVSRQSIAAEGGDVATVELAPAPPLSRYLTSLAAGPFVAAS